MIVTTTNELKVTQIKFPEIQLQTRDAHKLRGFFGNLFKEHSPLLHNHYDSGALRYRYPLIQYKVIDKVPMLVGIREGAELLPQLFLKIEEFDIDGKNYPVHVKNIETGKEEVGFTDELKEYQFKTLWMALNQKNHHQYIQLKSKEEKDKLLNRLIIGNILGFYSNIKLQLAPEERLFAKVRVQEKSTKFKGNEMLAFSGSFVVNALLPDLIGLGKSVSRGFGTVINERE